jgi:hypothetical protein
MRIVYSLFGAGCLALTLGAPHLNAQNVGIGTVSPLAKLTVIGSLAVGDNSFNVNLPSSTSSSNPNWTVNEAIFQGAVGVGTTNPTQYGRFCVLNDQGNNGSQDDIALVSFNNTTGPGPAHTFYAGRGTAASPGSLQNGDIPETLIFGYTTTWATLAQIANTFTGTTSATQELAKKERLWNNGIPSSRTRISS